VKLQLVALVTAGVLGAASPASAIAVKVSSRDCGTPPIEEVVGETVDLAADGAFVDPFAPDDTYVFFQDADVITLCMKCLGLTSLSQLVFEFAFDPPFQPLFSFTPAEGSAWSGFSSTIDGSSLFLTLSPFEGESPIVPNIELPDVTLDLFCDDSAPSGACNPFKRDVRITLISYTGLTATPVPEPGAMVLLGTGLTALAVRRRRRRR
jgi:PEP-CTERM motif